MKIQVKAGRTSLLVRVFLQDSSSTTGAGLTGLTSASSGLVCYRARDDDGNAGATQITLSAGTKGTWSSGGFVEKDATNMPGIYEFGVPNAAVATGSETVDIMFNGATKLAPSVMEIQIVAYDPQDAVHLGLSAIPNTACTTNGSLITSGTGTAQLTTSSGNVTVGTNNDKTGYGLSAAAVSSIWQDTTAGDFTVASSIGKSIMNGVALGTGLTIVSVSGTVGSVAAGVTVATNNDKTGYGISAAAVSSIWQDTTAGDFTVAASIGKSIMNGVALGTGLTINALTTNNDKTGYSLTQAFPVNFSALGISAGGHISNVDTLTTYTGDTPQTGDCFARLGAPAGASISADISTRATPAQVLTTALTESYAALHGVPTLTQAIFEIRAMLCEKSVSSTTLTVNKIDGATTAETFTLNSSTAPTAITRAS